MSPYTHNPTKVHLVGSRSWWNWSQLSSFNQVMSSQFANGELRVPKEEVKQESLSVYDIAEVRSQQYFQTI